MCLKTVLTKSPKEDCFFCIFVIENQTDNNKTINKRIMSSSICLLAVLLFVVAIGFMVAYFIRKHPEKISGFNVEEFDNDIVAASKWVNLLCRVTIIASFITLICGIIAVYLESNLMFALSVSVPITVGFIYAYSRKKGRHNAKEGYVNKPLLIVISFSFILQLIVVEKAVIPVRPPSAIPAELSTKVVTVDVPSAAPTLVATASAIIAPLMFFTLPASSIISVFAAAPIKVPMVLNMSMKTSTKMVRIMSPLNTLLKSICKKVGAMLCGILMGAKSAPIWVTPKGIPMRVQMMML